MKNKKIQAIKEVNIFFDNCIEKTMRRYKELGLRHYKNSWDFYKISRTFLEKERQEAIYKIVS